MTSQEKKVLLYNKEENTRTSKEKLLSNYRYLDSFR